MNWVYIKNQPLTNYIAENGNRYIIIEVPKVFWKQHEERLRRV